MRLEPIVDVVLVSASSYEEEDAEGLVDRRWQPDRDSWLSVDVRSQAVTLPIFKGDHAYSVYHLALTPRSAINLAAQLLNGAGSAEQTAGGSPGPLPADE